MRTLEKQNWIHLTMLIGVAMCFIFASVNARAAGEPVSADSSDETTNQRADTPTTQSSLPATILPEEGTVVSKISDGLYKLESGTILVRERKPVTVQTPHCEVQIHSRAAVLISAEPEVTHALDLYDWRYGCVKVNVGTRSKPLSPGDEIALAIADSPAAAQHLVLKDGLNRRQMKIVSLGGKQYAVASQFSLVDAMLKRPLISQLKTSKDKDERSTYEQIVKTAAALSLNGLNEPYAVHE